MDMKRFAFKMKLKPGYAEEYKKRHDAIWPELKELIKSTGVSDYSIYLDEETGILFASQKVGGDRITSYNVCYTKLLRRIP